MKIAIGKKMTAKKWKNSDISWSEFVNYLKEPERLKIDRATYLSLSKEDQLNIKDVGGYVAGYLKDGVRNSTSLESRSMITLDADSITDLDSLLFSASLLLPSYVVHSTLKHTTEHPRVRLIIPLSRDVDRTEYEAIARKIADDLDLANFDKTTFQADRLMFWSAVLQDQDFLFEEANGEPLDVTEWLSKYDDYKDVTEWARHDSAVLSVANKDVENPVLKGGLIGVFCRTYTIPEAIDKFLSDYYVKGNKERRYTYVEGTSANGLWISDDELIAYSHHGTDPANTGHAQNAFDLVRIHLFGDSKKSFDEMCKFATLQGEVVATLSKEKKSDALAERKNEEVELFSEEWRTTLLYDKNGNLENNNSNVITVLKFDDNFSKLFSYDAFTANIMLHTRPFWCKNKYQKYPKIFGSSDMEQLKTMLNLHYGLSKERTIEQSFVTLAHQNTIHSLTDRVTDLEAWDGVPRLDTWLIDYFGCDDNVYVREAGRITLFGAIARALKPSTKFDYVLTLIGAQGIGKSTVLEKLALGQKPTVLNTFEGKDAKSQLVGSWFIEIPELAAIRKSDWETVKAFLTATVDKYRPAYERSDKEFPRTAVFIATTNEEKFLQDLTGNRRFLPVYCTTKKYTDQMIRLTDQIARQIMAEAKERYCNDTRTEFEKLVLSEEAEELANVVRSQCIDKDERSNTVEEKLNLDLPANFQKMSIEERRAFYRDPSGVNVVSGNKRNTVCTKEIFVEMFGKDEGDFDRKKQRELNNIIKGVEGFAPLQNPIITTHFGKQRCYERKSVREIF